MLFCGLVAASAFPASLPVHPQPRSGQRGANQGREMQWEKNWPGKSRELIEKTSKSWRLGRRSLEISETEKDRGQQHNPVRALIKKYKLKILIFFN